AQETPATFIAFDLLVNESAENLLSEPLANRRASLERIIRKLGNTHSIQLSPATIDHAKAKHWLLEKSARLDGVIAKRLDAPYAPGERTMLKIKARRSADCVVGGFRYGEGTRQVGSLLLGLYNDEGKLDHVGFASNIPREERA